MHNFLSAACLFHRQRRLQRSSARHRSSPAHLFMYNSNSTVTQNSLILLHSLPSRNLLSDIFRKYSINPYTKHNNLHKLPTIFLDDTSLNMHVDVERCIICNNVTLQHRNAQTTATKIPFSFVDHRASVLCLNMDCSIFTMNYKQYVIQTLTRSNKQNENNKSTFLHSSFFICNK